MSDELKVDVEALAKALNRPAPLTDEPTAREITWTAVYGPADPDMVLRILSSSRALGILMNEWAGECPAQSLFDIANGDTESDTDEALHAKSVRTLLSIHARECVECADKLKS